MRGISTFFARTQRHTSYGCGLINSRVYLVLVMFGLDLLIHELGQNLALYSVYHCRWWHVLENIICIQLLVIWIHETHVDILGRRIAQMQVISGVSWSLLNVESYGLFLGLRSLIVGLLWAHHGEIIIAWNDVLF